MSGQATGFAHRPALDGLRGLAVLAVVAYHFDVLEGGYLGVDLFFVLSGFLITSLMIHEVDRTGTVSLRAFWLRRARRLLPALYVVLLAGAAYAAFIASEVELPAIRRDGISGLFYVANWAQITAHTAYFDRYGLPSIFRHLWSLAIEEQFYLLWPLIAGGILRFARRPVRVLGAVSAAGAAASMSAAVWMFTPGTPIERLYFGTDTRVGAILVGAFVACVSSVASESRPVRARRSAVASALSSDTGRTVISLVMLGLLLYSWVALHGTDPLLWQGGLALCGVVAGALIGVVGSRRPGALGMSLAVRPLVWFGTVSYGLYLWHWPVRVLLDESRIGLRGPALFVLRFAVSVALAAVSYYAVEQPIRRGAQKTTGQRLPVRRRRAVPGIRRLPALGGASTRPGRAAVLVAGASALIAGALVISTREPQVTMTATEVLAQANEQSAALPAASTTTTTAPPLVAAGTPLRVLVFGDSVGDNIGNGMEALAKSRGFEAESLAMVGCPFSLVRGRNKDTKGWIIDPPQCSTILDQFDAAVAADRPSLAVVSFGAAADFDRELPSGAIAVPCMPEYDQWRTQTWETVLGHMRDSGVPVAATTVSYYRQFGIDPNWDKQTDCLNKSLRAAADKLGVRVVDLAHWTCPDGTNCLDNLGGVTVRPDGLHYNEQLAPVVANWILSQVVGGWTVDNDQGSG